MTPYGHGPVRIDPANDRPGLHPDYRVRVGIPVRTPVPVRFIVIGVPLALAVMLGPFVFAGLFG